MTSSQHRVNLQLPTFVPFAIGVVGTIDDPWVGGCLNVFVLIVLFRRYNYWYFYQEIKSNTLF